MKKTYLILANDVCIAVLTIGVNEETPCVPALQEILHEHFKTNASRFIIARNHSADVQYYLEGKGWQNITLVWMEIPHYDTTI